MQRLVSLDVLRGATIALMVLVNHPGDHDVAYAPLKHAAWHGWTPTDVVFPTFLWIVGVAITLSRPKPLLHVLRRAAILFAIGVALYLYPDFDASTFRILGVLQRIAICYLVAALLFYKTGLREQLLISALLLIAYTAVMGTDFSVETNMAHRIDAAVLGSHNYKYTKTWDPEGVLSTVPAIVTCILGVIAGHLVRRPRVLAMSGAALIVAGYALSPWIPINKSLWTPSYTLLMAGIDCVLLAIVYWMVDIRGWQRWAKPLVIMGMNAIAVYVASEVLAQVFDAAKLRLYERLFLPLASPINASLLYALAYTGLMFVLAWVLHRRQVFVRI